MCGHVERVARRRRNCRVDPSRGQRARGELPVIVRVQDVVRRAGMLRVPLKTPSAIAPAFSRSGIAASPRGKIASSDNAWNARASSSAETRRRGGHGVRVA